MDIILASGSPRRKEILSDIGLDFEVLVSDADEESVDKCTEPKLYVQELALIKANAVYKICKKDALIISADTVVVYDGKILGKPKDEADAENMLRMLSGKNHSVCTGICIIDTKRAYKATAVCETQVFFDELTDETIKAYIKTGEYMDKAGAYGIQGLGALLVREIKGDYFNVVGLPVKTLGDLMKNEFNYDILGGK